MAEKSWEEWVTENLQRNCDPEEILGILLKKGFALSWIQKNMGDKYPAQSPQLNGSGATSMVTPNVDHKALTQVPLLSLGRFPGIKRFDDSRVQLLSLPNFLTDEECDGLVAVINPNLRPSTVTYVNEGFRTSHTCDLSTLKDPIIGHVDQKMADAMGINLKYSEGIQGQKYKVGEEFKPHTDYFQPGTEEAAKHIGPRGQRTWTFMIYLNDTPKGGGTQFVNLNQTFYPKKGSAVIWNNLYADGTPNADTLHWGMPIEEGEKIIITKWFRERGQGKPFTI